MAHARADKQSSSQETFERNLPDLSPIPAILTVIDEMAPNTLRECLKLICQRTMEDANMVSIMLEEAKYCDLDEEEEEYTLDYQPYKCEDPVADVMFKALLARTVHLDQTHKAQQKAEKKDRKKQMKQEREHSRAVQRKRDAVAEMDHDKRSLIKEASALVSHIQKLREYGDGQAIEQTTKIMRMKSNAAGQLSNQIAALNAIPVKMETCGHCGESFDANRSEPQSCRRHLGALKLDQKSDLWPGNWDVSRDDIGGLMYHMTKDLRECSHAKEHQASLPFFKWTCCDRSGNGQGCNIGKHLATTYPARVTG